jgi:anti-anti-sigma factor
MPRSRRTIHARVIVEIDRRPCAGVKETGLMEISTERKGDVLVAGAQDRIDGANAREFQEALQAVIDDSDRAVVLDLEQLTYISSAGLRVILLMGRMLQRQNGNFAVCSLSGPVREVFSISGFDKIIPTHDSQEDAVAALKG